MKAVFVGENGSMGLVTGKVYDISIQASRGYAWVRWIDEETGDGKACPYSSLDALHRNWQSPASECEE